MGKAHRHPEKSRRDPNLGYDADTGVGYRAACRMFKSRKEAKGSTFPTPGRAKETVELPCIG